MIRLKQLLTEKQFNSIDSLFEKLIYSDTALPISVPIVKKLVGNIKTTKVAHVTDYKGYQKLKKLEGKKKGISTFNRLATDSEILRGYGIATRGGVIAILEGKLLVNSDMDLFSQTDSQGRSWVQVSDLFFGKDSFLMPDVLPKEAKEFRNRYIYDGAPEPTGKEKRDYIKMYIDAATKAMLKRKKAFQKYYLLPSVHNHFSDKSWNELIVAQMKIKEVAFVTGVEFSRKGLEQKVKLPKNGVIIEPDEVPRFLTKHGIKFGK